MDGYIFDFDDLYAQWVDSYKHPNKDRTYYGAWEVDRVIESYFEPGYVGTGIDIGAGDGIILSNTLYFEKLGWDILCLEANYTLNMKCWNNRNHAYRFAVHSVFLNGTFKVFTTGDVKTWTFISSAFPNEKLIADIKPYIIKKRYERAAINTLRSILTRHVDEPFRGIKYVDFIVLDIEGSEIYALHGIDFKSLDIKLIVVSNRYREKYIGNYLSNFGYVLDKQHYQFEFYVKK